MKLTREEILGCLKRFLNDLLENMNEAANPPKVAPSILRLSVGGWANKVEKFLEENHLFKDADQIKNVDLTNRDDLDYLISEIEKTYIKLIDEIIRKLEQPPDQPMLAKAPSGPSSPFSNATSKTHSTNQKVFIVHGHDTPNLKRLKNLLKDKFGLDPIVLAERPGGVKPLIKKFEDEAKQVAFAFVLMTPDDVIGGKKYAQARPNVFFELGWFFGWFLCRTDDSDNRGVCILYQKRGKKVPSKINTDLDGVSRVEFDHSIENKETTDAIENELRAAGLIED